MTVGGVYGPDVEAVSDEDAIAHLEEDGYETVLDVVDDQDGPILVVEG